MTSPAVRDARLDFSNILLFPSDTLRTAMERMTSTATSIVLVVDETKKLVGVLVDGDIRRALLLDPDLSQPVAKVMTRRPRTAPFGIAESELRALANETLSAFLPLVDDEGIPRALIDLVRLKQSRPALENAVVLMAGGRGERLMPHTAMRPKPMIEVGGRPILETLVRVLHGHGFERFYLSVNYLASAIEEYFKDGSWLGVQIDYLREDAPLGTAGSLRPLLGREKAPMLVMNGDVLTRFNPRTMVDHHYRQDVLATLAVRDYEIRVPFGVIEMQDMRLSQIREKPVYTVQISAGIYVLSPEVLVNIPQGERFDMPALLESVAQTSPGKVGCYPISDFWVDVGREEDLMRARADYEKHF